MKRQSFAQWAGTLAGAWALAAQAGPLDDFNKIRDALTRAQPAAAAATRSADSDSPTAAVTDNDPGRALILPLGLSAYPRAQLQRRVDNPFERVRIPLTPPQHTPDGMVSAYSVPVEGRVTMLQFRHRQDDSPALIQRHYEAWLASQGFERLLVCEAPCGGRSNHDWRKMVDPTERLDSNYIPQKATFIAAYKPDAMVLVGVGTFINEFSSLVKVVEGRVIDAQPWKTLTTPAKPLAAATPTMPPPPAPAPAWPTTPATPGSGASSAAATEPPTPAGVEMIAAADLRKRLAESRGFVVLQLSSFDPNCPFCVKANPVFDQLAERHAGRAAFWRVMWQPWPEFANDPFPKAYGVGGIPTTFTFKNGQIVRRADGQWPLDQMEKKLLQGLR